MNWPKKRHRQLRLLELQRHRSEIRLSVVIFVGGPNRKLRVVLQYASQIAHARQVERITPDILTETLRLTQIPQVPAPRQRPTPSSTGPYEAASEERPPRS